MLNLTVREGEYLLIGSDIKITLNKGSYKDSLSMGIDAPKSIKILRGKLYEKMIMDKADGGDKEALEISQGITADRYQRERIQNEKIELSRKIREKKAMQKQKLENAEAAPV